LPAIFSDADKMPALQRDTDVTSRKKVSLSGSFPQAFLATKAGSGSLPPQNFARIPFQITR
jgi:hypothetical protein